MPYFVLWSDTAHDPLCLETLATREDVELFLTERFSRGQRVRYVFRGDLLEHGVKVYLDDEAQSSSDEFTHFPGKVEHPPEGVEERVSRPVEDIEFKCGRCGRSNLPVWESLCAQCHGEGVE